ncbi:MAG: DUF2520 domain-containing protein [Clostridium sp.]|nr:DUF2520 domain-containing protein [Prevotella sp.]MCM1428799.1 DUF2520 domain-containing protein [Clostridium sp.]MCM1475174.1 DUF2520 domain-containing protein [Muribaculaceae bacterium]
MRLLYYNPEHDFTLALGSGYYTPTASVAAMRLRTAPMMAALGEAGDLLTIPAPLSEEERKVLENNPLIKESGVIPLSIDEFSEQDLSKKITEIIPWGWDLQVKKSLLKIGINPDIMPSDEQLEKLRQLSHRNTTIDFNALLYKTLRNEFSLPQEFYDIEEAIAFAHKNPGCYFKAPWSSSGRGVVRSSDIPEDKLKDWLRGVLKRQGSVMGEVLAEKAIDFATEWELHGGEADFVGYSVFKTDSSGRYISNIEGSQNYLEYYIYNYVNQNKLQTLISLQKEALEKLIATDYTGPAGIDMMANDDGSIIPCVEINLRMTMGRLQIYNNQKRRDEESAPGCDTLVMHTYPKVTIIGGGNVATHLYKAFKPVADTDIIDSRALKEIRKDADYYVICVKDEAIPVVSERLGNVGGIVVHTSGATSIDILRSHPLRGVLYPLQTFTKDRDIDYSSITFFIEGDCQHTEQRLFELAHKISNNVNKADSEQRKRLHLAGVFANNFVTKLYGISEGILRDAGYSPKTILPLLKETISKLGTMTAEEAMTGPARRNDKATISAHEEILKHDNKLKELELYRLITEIITSDYIKSTEGYIDTEL